MNPEIAGIFRDYINSKESLTYKDLQTLLNHLQSTRALLHPLLPEMTLAYVYITREVEAIEKMISLREEKKLATLSMSRPAFEGHSVTPVELDEDPDLK